jgi:hypothetical protein
MEKQQSDAVFTSIPSSQCDGAASKRIGLSGWAAATSLTVPQTPFARQ